MSPRAAERARIAHLGMAACRIHPPGRKKKIAITPPKIFSKEVAQKQATTSPARTFVTAGNRFRPFFRGWRLDEFSIFARPPHRGLPHACPHESQDEMSEKFGLGFDILTRDQIEAFPRSGPQ